MDIVIRAIASNIDEAAALLNLENKIFNDCRYSPKELLEILQQKGNRVYVAIIGNAFVGFVSLLRVNTLHYRGMWVDLIGVDEEYRGLGIGKKLLQIGKGYAAEEGVQLLSGLIAKNNTASLKAFLSKDFKLVEKDYSLAFYELNESKS